MRVVEVGPMHIKSQDYVTKDGIIMGAHQGRVTRIDGDGVVWAEIGNLAIDQEFPCRVVNTVIEGDDVLVINIDGALEDLVIIGKMKSEL
jgi:hypothetical protein